MCVCVWGGLYLTSLCWLSSAYLTTWHRTFSLTPRVLVVGREVVFAPHVLCAMFGASLTTDTYLSFRVLVKLVDECEIFQVFYSYRCAWSTMINKPLPKQIFFSYCIWCSTSTHATPCYHWLSQTDNSALVVNNTRIMTSFTPNVDWYLMTQCHLCLLVGVHNCPPATSDRNNVFKLIAANCGSLWTYHSPYATIFKSA